MYLTKKTNLVYIYILYICHFLYINFRTHKRYQKGNVNIHAISKRTKKPLQNIPFVMDVFDWFL